ncbi:MAG: sensor domain-containing phosphodiesterase [Jatrophihabitans sp.]
MQRPSILSGIPGSAALKKSGGWPALGWPPVRGEAEGAPSIGAVIDQGAIRTVFQPVVHIESHTIAGFEALSRGPINSRLETPLALLQAASRAGRLSELDWLCRVHALQAATEANLPPDLSWLINVEPAGLAIECPAHLRAAEARAKASLRVILEVVERDVEGHVSELLNATDQARRDSWGVALDDVGAEAGSLALLPFLRPDVVKLDMSLVSTVQRCDAASITAAVRAYSERTGAVILAEGIETLAQEQLAQVFGATYAQGYRYGRPGSLPHTVAAPTHIIPLRQRLTPVCGMTPFDILAASMKPRREAKAQLLHISHHLEEQSGRGGEASVLLASLPDSSQFSHRQRQRYEHLSRLNAFTVVQAAGAKAQSAPRYRITSFNNQDQLKGEWAVIVVSPHFASAFIARDCGDTGNEAERRYDYIYTHNRDAVIAAARSFLHQLSPDSKPALAGDVRSIVEGLAATSAHLSLQNH